ncbi:PIN domain-containing protein [Actinomycetospora sp. TBRC 11914]|uniref:PIN domain-containing protein n=1 Tax=Actinomycetospora sp. TBRC 11914 TaxID=2729387 RepID=UPI0020C02B37|nr:hypothetical protein [Actinomycetospora sp. TBRC 11914]
MADAPHVVAALDTNVFLDLLDRSRSGFEESSSLLADWVPDHLDLATTNQVANELNRSPSAEMRAKQSLALSNYRSLTASADLVQQTFLGLKAQVPTEAYEADKSLESDTMHVAAAIASGAHILVTRDTGALGFLRKPALELHNFRLLRPSELLVHLDELANAVVYSPAELHRTSYTEREVAAGEEDLVCGAFLNKQAGERKSDFLTRWRYATASSDRWRRRIILGEDGRSPAVLLVSGYKEGVYEVEFLRVAASRLAETLAFQALSLVRMQACEVGATLVRLRDTSSSAAAVTAALQDGYVRAPDGSLECPVADFVGSFSRVRSWAFANLPRQFFESLPGDRPCSIGLAYDLELRWWPLKITGASIPTFIIPIRPQWSTNLFGVPAPLFERDAVLGLSREHVYYRSPRPQPIAAGPGRLLWYVSGEGRDAISSVVACSHLRSVTEDTPQSLYDRFKHLGVWSVGNIELAARDGLASAIRFTGTEIFEKPVTYKQLRQIYGDCRTPTLQSPTRISEEIFEAIYRKGRRLA